MKKSDIEAAFKKYNSGVRPWIHKSQDWFVIDGNRKTYPVKYIWALAINKKPRSFHSRDARKKIEELGYAIVNMNYSVHAEFEKKVQESIKLTKDERKKRLKAAPKTPKQKAVTSITYDRNPDVVAEVLERAKGVCEQCIEDAPFLRAKDKTPYLEVHHKIPLKDGGFDTVENALAVCPNCHRELHFGCKAG